MHFRVGARQQLAVLVIDDELREQCTRRRVDRARGAVEGGGVGLARAVRESELGLQARGHGRGVSLWDGHIRAQAVHVGNTEQRRPVFSPAAMS